MGGLTKGEAIMQARIAEEGFVTEGGLSLWNKNGNQIIRIHRCLLKHYKIRIFQVYKCINTGKGRHSSETHGILDLEIGSVYIQVVSKKYRDPGRLFCLLLFCFCCSRESPGCRLFGTASMLEWLRKLLTHHSHGEQYGKMEPKYTEGGHCQSVLRPQGVFNIPPLFLIIQWRRQRHLTWSATHDVVSREINIWKKFRPLSGIEPVTIGTKCRMLNR